jgi:three-Cys-motif partner protein
MADQDWRLDMPVQRGVGFGPFTRLKLGHLRAIVAMHISITRAVLEKHRFYAQAYHFIDATAGPGSYEVYGEEVQGSPLMFLSLAETAQLRYKADLIEKEPANVDTLRQQLPVFSCGSVDIHCCEYALIIPEMLPSKDKTQLGLFFVDPSNGIPDFDTVAYVSRMRPRMEVLMYLSATNLKREHGITTPLLLDRMARIEKSHWMVRKPIPGDAHHWTFLLGSNTDLFREYRKIDFYPLNSREAQEFFPKLNLTVKQRFERLQRRLFD